MAASRPESVPLLRSAPAPAPSLAPRQHLAAVVMVVVGTPSLGGGLACCSRDAAEVSLWQPANSS